MVSSTLKCSNGTLEAIKHKVGVFAALVGYDTDLHAVATD